MKHEAPLAVIPSAQDGERMVLSLRIRSGRAGTSLVLTQQTFSERVGWYNQHTVELQPSQIDDLRSALGTAKAIAGNEGPREWTVKFPEPQSAIA